MNDSKDSRAADASSEPADEAGSATFPKAKVVTGPWAFFDAARVMWGIAAICLLAAIVLIVAAMRPSGVVIHIEFEQGYGLAPGDSVRLRGIDVGEVESVSLTEDLERVEVEVRLAPASASLARNGSRFWIERPQVSLSQVSGLDTIVGPKYIGVQPGDGASKFRFQGVPSPRQFRDTEAIGITVRFRQGHGIVTGAPVRFRGMSIGEVVNVELDESLGHVLVHAELQRSAARLAQDGAQYWIERPEVSMSQVRGLDTLISGAYLSASPAPTEGDAQLAFEGLDAAPAQEQTGGGLEIVLESPSRFGIKAGSPLLHRGVEIGKIVRVGLASDGASVEARAFVAPNFRDLVRSNSRFWSNSGVGVEIGILSGVELDAESLETITAGGVAMATPNEPGKTVATGRRFTLAEKAEDEWLEWKPLIAVGRTLLPDGVTAPNSIRCTVRYQRRRFGFMRDQQMHCWAHAMSGNRMWCPWEGELPNEITLEVLGKSFDLSQDRLALLPGSIMEINAIETLPGYVWPQDRVRRPASAENAVLLGGPDSLPISAGRFSGGAESGDWKVDLSMELSEDWNGASVVAQSDGRLIGILNWNGGRPEIGLIASE